jgi:hypothetical protein
MIEVAFQPDLTASCKSITLTLDAEGAASAPIDDTWSWVGVRSSSATDGRVGLTAPEADGAATGAAVAADLKKGFPLLDSATWQFFGLGGPGPSRTLSILGTAGDTYEVVGS